MEIYTENLQLPDVRLNIRHFVNAKNSAKKIFFLHGWMDASPSWQFVVNALQKKYHIIAPDWRGFGLSEWLDRIYPFREHLADLHAILKHYSFNEPAYLVGHSMGGMLALTYAGLKPENVDKVITLEGFGLTQKAPDFARPLLQNWLENRFIRPKMFVYPNENAFKERLLIKNPRLKTEQADFLAPFLSKKIENGVVFNADPWHKAHLPQRFPVEEIKAIWQFVQAPVLWVQAQNSWVMEEFKHAPEDYFSRIALFAHIQTAQIENCSHMLHHDQPEKVAALIDLFFD